MPYLRVREKLAAGSMNSTRQEHNLVTGMCAVPGDARPNQDELIDISKLWPEDRAGACHDATKRALATEILSWSHDIDFLRSRHFLTLALQGS